MGRLTDKDLARRVVVEPKRSILPYLIVATIAAIIVWTLLQPAIPDPSSVFKRIAPPETSEPGPRASRGDVRTVFSADDYPADAQRKGEEGTVQARLAIDSSGRVSNCTVIRSSGFKSLDDATCSILTRRARFNPARDAAGRRVPDTVVTPPVKWQLEG